MFALRLAAPGTAVPVIAADGPDPVVPERHVRVRVRAASINAADLAAAAGYRASPGRPTVLGSDGAGITDDGREVIIYPILADRAYADPMLDPRLRMLGQGVDGTFAQTVALPETNLVIKPPAMPWEYAACLGTAWLTAYRMLTSRGRLLAGETVLVPGTGGGVSTALITLARTLGGRVWVLGRNPDRRRWAVEQLGADAAFSPDQALPGPVDLACDSVGGAVFERCLATLRPGGRIVVAGSSAGASARLDLPSLFVRSIGVLGSAMGTTSELSELAQLVTERQATPTVDSVWDLADGVSALAHARDGHPRGKVVLRMQ